MFGRHQCSAHPACPSGAEDAHKVGGAQWSRLKEASRAEQLRTPGAKVFNAARPGFRRNVLLYLAMTGGAYLAYSYYSVLMAKSPYQAKLRPNVRAAGARRGGRQEAACANPACQQCPPAGAMLPDACSSSISTPRS